MRPPTILSACARRPAHRAPAAHRGAARLLRDARGATIVEFAIVAVPFFALMLAVAVTSLAYFVQETLETAVERAARGIVTGRTQAADNNGTMSGMTRAQLAERFRQAGCASLPAFLPCSRLYVEVKSAVDWTLLDNSPPAIAGDDGAGRGSRTRRRCAGGDGATAPRHSERHCAAWSASTPRRERPCPSRRHIGPAPLLRSQPGQHRGGTR
jgi:Flp pilus assembly protein TadG